MLIACSVLFAYLAAYALVTSLLPRGSLATLLVTACGLLALELALLAVCWWAFRTRSDTGPRWIWLLLGAWTLGNLFGDGVWTLSAVMNVELLGFGLPDIGYLFAYISSIAVLVALNWHMVKRLRTPESVFDAAIFVLGAAGLAWPLVFAPMFESNSYGAEPWLRLTYPILGILMVLAFVALIFGHADQYRRRPPAYFTIICAAFLLQVVSDAAFLVVQTGNGSPQAVWPDWLRALGYAFAGLAVLHATAWPDPRPVSLEPDFAEAPGRSRLGHPSRPWRVVLPYATLPILTGVLATQLSAGGWQWDAGTKVLMYMASAMVGLLVGRQYLALFHNRRLNSELAEISRQLERRVAELADVNQRLETLNDSSHRLTSLRQPHAVARAGLEMACTFTRSPGGWIAIGEGADYTVMTYGAVEDYPRADLEALADAELQGLLRSVPLTTRGEDLGTMLLLERPGDEPSADLVPMVAVQIANALDNAKRYEEALQLAERDPLTGLYNHRGIHRRLAGEALRAQQSGSELSLIMIDLDDFKVLNDTHGHVAGDSVLRQVSDAIRVVLRHADLAGRVGGDELLLVLPNTGSEGAMQLSERLRVALAARPYQTAAGQSVPVYLSLGVATMPEDASSVGQLIEVADVNLYTSKQRGGNTTTGSSTQKDEVVGDHGVLGIAGRLLDSVGARDHYTRRHSEHVVRNALALGEALGLSKDSLQTLHVAAMLHDVGNLRVSQELLRRPGLLDPTEEQQVREHVLMGAQLILDIPRLSEVAEAVSAHHERYDGSGYPTQTAGDDIPLLGRILAVADAYSAMTLDRPYRKSMSRAQAREELLKGSGGQLDPELVQTFICLLDARDENPTAEHAAAG